MYTIDTSKDVYSTYILGCIYYMYLLYTSLDVYNRYIQGCRIRKSREKKYTWSSLCCKDICCLIALSSTSVDCSLLSKALISLRSALSSFAGGVASSLPISLPSSDVTKSEATNSCCTYSSRSQYFRKVVKKLIEKTVILKHNLKQTNLSKTQPSPQTNMWLCGVDDRVSQLPQM